MRVYRFERNGMGPYVGQDTPELHDLHWKHGRDNPGRPGWLDDRLPRYEEYLSGCESALALLCWFDGFLGALERAGYEIAEYEVDPEFVKLGLSGLQLSFDSTKAVRVPTHRPV